MEQKRVNLNMDGYDETGMKVMDVHGPFSFEELKEEMLQALIHNLIPIVHLVKTKDKQTNSATEQDRELLHEVKEIGTLYVHWSYKGVEFEAEGPEEFVLRASKEMMEAMQ